MIVPDSLKLWNDWLFKTFFTDYNSLNEKKVELPLDMRQIIKLKLISYI